MVDMIKAEAEITREEDNIPYVYQDEFGFWTIGIGILVDRRKGGRLLPEEVTFIFQNRCKIFMLDLVRALPWLPAQPDAVQRALLNMAFQMGIEGILMFKNMLAALQRGDRPGAADAALDSSWADQTPARAQRVAELIRSGV